MEYTHGLSLFPAPPPVLLSPNPRPAFLLHHRQAWVPVAVVTALGMGIGFRSE